VVATLVVDDQPQAVAVDVLHSRINVANVHGDSITANDGETNKVIGTYSAGKNPMHVRSTQQQSGFTQQTLGSRP
jgi:DNA-binding beta-propeller fold protein YncE